MSDRTLGERIAELRRQRGMSQRELAAALSRSESWVSQVERDIQPVERLSMLHALAQVLGVSVRELRPEAVPAAGDAPNRPNDLDGLRVQLSGHPALSRLFNTPDSDSLTVDTAILATQVEQAWTLAHESHFARLNDVLIDLVPTLEAAARTDTAASDIHALRARAYQAASAAFARQDEPDAAWLAADRAIAAAEQSGDTLAVTAGHFRLAHAFIRLGRYDQAEHVTLTALDALARVEDDSDAAVEALSLLGAMHLVAAVICGHENNRPQARTHLADGRRIAERIGTDRNDYDTEFGPTNVQLHTVAVAVDLADAGEALDVAQGIDATGLSPERQARLLVDIARAHVQRRHAGEALAALVEAERIAPEQVRSHHLARAAFAEIIDQFGRRPPEELLGLGQRMGSRVQRS